MSQRIPRFFNRELSWLEFNQRVLDEARDASLPLLERLKFLAITASNLDEFFMVRVGGLQLLARQGNTKPDPSGLTPQQQLEAIGRRASQMVSDQYTCLIEELDPRLSQAGIRRLQAADLSEKQARVVEQLFESEILPVMTPMAVDTNGEFPLLINQSLNVCVRLKPAPPRTRQPRYAILPFGRLASRFITLPSEGGYAYMLFEDVVLEFIERFFPGEEVLECVPFRITRNADLSLREDLASDLLAQMQQLLDERKLSDCVRLEIVDGASAQLRRFLKQRLEVDERDIYSVAGPLDLSSFMQLTELRGYDDLKYDPWPPQPSPLVDPRKTVFESIARRDILLYHPYESFEPVQRLVEEAASDPDVLAIKQTLYRTSRDSPIVAALMRAAEAGKYVTAIVELKARFDEARNIEWARNLERAGVQVIYGVKGLKTHAKLCIVVRREPHGIRRYVHFGTGNYNEQTARLYSDASYLTCHEEFGADATAFFNAISGYSQPQRFRKLEAAPIGLRERLLELIAAETTARQQGQPARIRAKLNSLVDPAVIEALYDASQAGVDIDLNIRGICCLRPGVKGLSERIRVVSIVDRFLEHARILQFHHGGDDLVFISSADWMPRNLDRRVELLIPIEDADARNRLIEILDVYFRDNVKGRWLQPDGSYRRAEPADPASRFRSQEVLYWQACQASREAAYSRRTVFEPHRAASGGS